MPKATNHALGSAAERRIAEKINDIQPGHNVRRVGGVERHKWVYPGDIGCVKRDKRGKTACRQEGEAGRCVWDDYYFEIKRRKNKSVPSWWRKTLKDAPQNRIPVLIWWKAHSDWRVREGFAEDSYEDFTLDEWINEIETSVREEEADQD